MKDVNELYCSYLQELLGECTGDISNKKCRLQNKLTSHYGDRLSIISQTSGSAFICASNIPLGDALTMLQKLQVQDSDEHTLLLNAAKLLRKDAKKCKIEQKNKDVTVSHDGACEVIPDSLNNFCCTILHDASKLPPEGCKRVIVDKHIEERQ